MDRPERFCARRYQAHPVSSELCIARLETGAEVLVNSRQHAVLSAWRSWRAPSAETPISAEEIRTLRALGLLLSERDLPAMVGAGGGASIHGAGVVTRGDTETVARALRSYLENARQFARTLEIVVLNDAPDRQAAEQMRSMLRGLGLEFAGSSFRHADRTDKQAFADALAREAGVEPALVNFCLFGGERVGSTHGANTNALLLDSAGSPVLKLDDDTVCRLRGAPTSNTLVLTSRRPPLEIRAFADRQELQAWMPEVQADFIGAHEELLGRDTSALLAGRQANQLSLETASPELTEILAQGRGHVAVTSAGIMGDSGSVSSLYYLLLEGDELMHLAESDQHYEDCCVSRLVWKGVRHFTVADGTFCQSTALGLDTRQLLPPFFPVLRAADATFGSLLRVMWPQALLGFPAVSVAHEPVPPRRDERDALWRAFGALTFQQLLGLCLQHFQPGVGQREPEARLAALGQHLETFAALPRAELEACLRPDILRRSSGLLVVLERQRARWGKRHPVWAEDVRRAHGVLLEAVQRDGFAVPRDLMDRVADPAWAWGTAQRLIQTFGRLLRVWADLFAAAQRLRARGVRLSRALV